MEKSTPIPAALPGLQAHADDDGLLTIEGLAGVPGIAHVFETRATSLADAMPSPVARLHQVHGATVHRLPADPAAWSPYLEPKPDDRPAGDALITDAVGVTVAVSVADCLPILIADPENRVVAAVHGGWRGLAGGIVGTALAALSEGFGSDPGRCVIAIGPGIGACCYEIGPEVAEAFVASGLEEAVVAPFEGASEANNATASSVGTDAASGKRPSAGSRTAHHGPRAHLHLAGAAIAEAERCGVPPTQIFETGLCTRCNGDWLWSYRRDGDAAGRMLGGIALVRE